MRNRFKLALTVALLGVTAIGGVVLATDASGVSSTSIASGRLDAVNLNVKTGNWMTQLRTKGESTLAVVENRVAVGGSFGWHSHPGPSLIIVKSGTITFYRANDPTCTGVEYKTGDALVDPGNEVHVGRNEGSQEVVVIVTRLIPVGAPARIDEPDPGTC
jgi:quercetin dioxygenase-like cupin family protein